MSKLSVLVFGRKDQRTTYPCSNLDALSAYLGISNLELEEHIILSSVLHAKEPEKHVFHIVTDKLNFAAMRMWFVVNAPAGAAMQVQNVDDFTWLNSSYCPVLRQLESARMIDYYFKVHAHQASSLTAGSDNLKYRNPKYLLMLNHPRFYLPEVYPKLDKILFLDDDIVVQKDLTPLWSVNMQGMVNGAVETCKINFHRFNKYLNFSNSRISDNFDPNACGWAFGMNIFDLQEWISIVGKPNEERTLWKLGTLPPGLITFYNLTYPLDRSWHVFGLGYDPALNQAEMENAAVVHYNGNHKPWLDLAIAKYKSYWSSIVVVVVILEKFQNIKEIMRMNESCRSCVKPEKRTKSLPFLISIIFPNNVRVFRPHFNLFTFCIVTTKQMDAEIKENGREGNNLLCHARIK
ncbi:hypothetical protein BUALT_Bualt19G0130500 [Buddleja alternifolia]|uniref:Hexosyltransferase n=1 Tax=Buddleja alternifolia TaxID=168488 RepID=A0AAV6W2P7_9LAMI|nr:hypothetical protein BUALT_Bualt19G0130500 [Buddleja alternifolia]